VRLDAHFVEGLVHINTLGQEGFIFDEHLHLLRGRRSGTCYRLGDALEVRLAAVHLEERKMEFQLLTPL
jgi:ribonuclease R